MEIYSVGNMPPPCDVPVIVLIPGVSPFVAVRYKAHDRDWWHDQKNCKMTGYRPDHMWSRCPMLPESKSNVTICRDTPGECWRDFLLGDIEAGFEWALHPMLFNRSDMMERFLTEARNEMARLRSLLANSGLSRKPDEPLSGGLPSNAGGCT